MNFKNFTIAQIKNFLKDYDNFENMNEIIDELSKDSRSSVVKFVSAFRKKIDALEQRKQMNKEFYDFDRKYICNNDYIIVGCDEVGRGPLAGPIVCASVVLDLINDANLIQGINDSKKIKSREFKKELSEIIKEKAIKFKIVEIDNEEIDKIGIGVANQNGLRLSVEQLGIDPDLVLSDGYLIKDINYKNISVIKGDAKSASIMCASIIAKVYRDELMIKYHEEFPEYDFFNNVGYGTKVHVDAIKKNGICKYHRRTFLKNYI